MPAKVIFTMDNLGDAADLHRGVIQEPRKTGENYPLEIGFPSMMELWDKYGIVITYFVEGWSARQYPEEMQRILASRHSIGMHGWMHEMWHELPEDRQLELAKNATESIQRATNNLFPTAFRAPGGLSTKATNRVLNELGYTIDASLPDEDGTLCNIPYDWACVDATHWLWDDKSCDEVEAIWRQTLEKAAQDNKQIVFIWHPQIMGMTPERIQVGEKIIQFVLSDPERFHIVTLEHQRKELLDQKQSP